jgi:hypothetical protein
MPVPGHLRGQLREEPPIPQTLRDRWMDEVQEITQEQYRRLFENSTTRPPDDAMFPVNRRSTLSSDTEDYPHESPVVGTPPPVHALESGQLARDRVRGQLDSISIPLTGFDRHGLVVRIVNSMREQGYPPHPPHPGMRWEATMMMVDGRYARAQCALVLNPRTGVLQILVERVWISAQG